MMLTLFDSDNFYLIGFIRTTVYILGILIAIWPSNWIIRKIIKKWKPQSDEPADKMGAFIGSLERILIILLIAMQSLTAVGLVITMKSIARYDKIQNEKAFAEYFLAGTMLSTLLALLIGIVIQKTVGSI